MYLLIKKSRKKRRLINKTLKLSERKRKPLSEISIRIFLNQQLRKNSQKKQMFYLLIIKQISLIKFRQADIPFQEKAPDIFIYMMGKRISFIKNLLPTVLSLEKLI